MNFIIVNTFFCINIANQDKLKQFDSSNYDVIVFDEIYFNDVHKLARIRKFVIDNPDKIIIATGDTSQLPPIEQYTNQKTYSEYADECINMIFKNEIFLLQNKRLKTLEDQQKLKTIKEDIFNKGKGIIATLKQHFKFTKDITQSFKNIAYKNDTCTEVNKHIRKKINKNSI